MTLKSRPDVALLILEELLKIQRHDPERARPLDILSQKAVKAWHLPRIQAFINAQKKIEFILPAFPSKSPNLNKVLGVLPDMAERISLSFLNALCQRIQDIYPPGAKLTICSDGRVFGDLVRTHDDTISAYQHALHHITGELRAHHLAFFNLDDFLPLSRCPGGFDGMRQQLLKKFAEPLAGLKQQLISNEAGTLLYRAMTRFLFEDGLTPDYCDSKSNLQKDAKQRALEVIQRSRAWATLLDRQFPDAIRLSIHPQATDSRKIGIHMMPTHDDWLTPWHGVAVDYKGRFVLMKRSEAESLGASIVMRDQQPSHYEIDRPRVVIHCGLPVKEEIV